MQFIHLRVVGRDTEYGPRDQCGFQHVFVQANSLEEAERTGEAIIESPPEDHYVMNWHTIQIP